MVQSQALVSPQPALTAAQQTLTEAVTPSIDPNRRNASAILRLASSFGDRRAAGFGNMAPSSVRRNIPRSGWNASCRNRRGHRACHVRNI